MSAFSVNLKAARTEAGLSQSEAARRAGMPQPLWSRYECGRQLPSLDQAERLAEAVGATLPNLIRKES